MKKVIGEKEYNIRPGMDLHGVDFHGVDLSGANLRDAIWKERI